MRLRPLLASLVLASLPLTAGGAPSEPPKNLQVLPKTSTREQIKAIMKTQARALGVECDYCHDVPDMASDANKMKALAREMMKMTVELNAKYIKGLKDGDKNQVTCGTCHRGKETPPPFGG